jgi:hypothetical protein
LFSDSDLRGADFTGANITFASFSGAMLEGACFANCIGIESTNLPDSVKQSARLTDPAIRRSILIRHGINAAIVTIVSGSVLMVIANLSPLGPARRDLAETRANVAKVGKQLEAMTAHRDKLTSELSELQRAVSQQRKTFLESRMHKSQGETKLSRADIKDLARSLDQLMSDNPSSVQKYVLYFSSLDVVEQKYGSAGRLAVVDALINLNPGKPGFTEFLRTSGLVSQKVSQEQIEQVLKERFDNIERGDDDKQSFWENKKSDWSQYWSQRFRDAGML